MVTVILVVLAGLIDGITEGFEFDNRKSFERKYKVSPTSFFGSKSWTNKSERKHAWSTIFGVFDFYHVGDDLRKGFLIAGVMLAVMLELNIDHFLLFIIIFFIHGAFKKAGMWWIRK